MSTQTAPQQPSCSSAPGTVHVVLVPGFWLGAWAWDDVLPGLRAAGLVPHPVTLPGLGSPAEDRSGLTLEDHVEAVTALVDDLDGDVVLVGHSGGAVVVQSVVDRHPERVRRVVYVDSGPLRDGVALQPGVQSDGPDLPLPTWEELEAEGNSIEGLGPEDRATLRDRAVPHPSGVAGSPVLLGDPRRLQVPVTLICTSIPAALLHELVAAGQIPAELPDLHDVTSVDLPTGHWPMFSRPADLAAAIAAAATS
ncbi:alpha/beta fold hydrolase [Actinotalea sp. K2]|uniref:alpha/beta fold hydrolase n=1 Tax=Actinotalea sp. K2 TaxID=2939438 RepID=UPI00201761C9|nr:alpha/beta hydrolase [Actinotalea sp. K2]MCL3861673.1 alpha/beta hydrolase [Actinotalea sp. K2]